MKQTAAIIITDGFEELEAITVVDILRRGGIEVSVIGHKNTSVIGAHNLAIQTDDMFANIATKLYDCIILPGGPGCYNLRGDKSLNEFLNKHLNKNKWICAICAAPLILHDAGILKDKQYTAHPCTYAELTRAISSEPVVVDGKLITAAGPGASLRFGLTILKNLTDERTMHQLANSMLVCEKF